MDVVYGVGYQVVVFVYDGLMFGGMVFVGVGGVCVVVEVDVFQVCVGCVVGCIVVWVYGGIFVKVIFNVVVQVWVVYYVVV